MIAAVAAALTVPAASAAWTSHSFGNGTSRSKTLGTGNVPTIVVAARKVTVTWTASTFATGGNVAAYSVRRYSAVTGALQAIGAACASLVTGLTCTENNTPTGVWQYTATPAAGNWRGAESGKSSIATVI